MSTEEIVGKFRAVDVSTYPNFYNLKTPLERGLWVLWIAKDELKIKRMTAEEIVMVVTDVQEIAIDKKTIIYAFNRAQNIIRTYRDGNIFYYEIMKPGKDRLLSQAKHVVGVTEDKKHENYLYFKPNTYFTSKVELAEKIISKLKGELRILDPYCDSETLSMLSKYAAQGIKFITRIENFRNESKRKVFLTELEDFCKEFKNAEFKSYPYNTIHDRYIISSNALVLIGYSLKDIGNKESFAVFIEKQESPDTYQLLLENFNSKWAESTKIP